MEKKNTKTYKANNYIPDDHHVPYTLTFGYGPHVGLSPQQSLRV